MSDFINSLTNSATQPIRCKTRTNHDLVAGVFRFAEQFVVFCCEFSFLKVFFLYLIGRYDNFGFDLHRKTEKRTKNQEPIKNLVLSIYIVYLPYNRNWTSLTID